MTTPKKAGSILTSRETDKRLREVVAYLSERKERVSKNIRSFHDREGLAVELDSALTDLTKAVTRLNVSGQ